MEGPWKTENLACVEKQLWGTSAMLIEGVTEPCNCLRNMDVLEVHLLRAVLGWVSSVNWHDPGCSTLHAPSSTFHEVHALRSMLHGGVKRDLVVCMEWSREYADRVCRQSRNFLSLLVKILIYTHLELLK